MITLNEIDAAFSPLPSLLDAHLRAHGVADDVAIDAASRMVKRYVGGAKFLLESPTKRNENKSRLTFMVAFPMQSPLVARVTITHDRLGTIDVGALPDLWLGLAKDWFSLDDHEISSAIHRSVPSGVLPCS